VQKIEQTVKLIRSKGVGVYFVTQNPLDIPDSVLAQLGNRIQHALRAYTPREEKAVTAAASAFRPNPKFDTRQAIGELGKGEALVSVLDLKAVPSMVERTLIRPPSGRMGTITPEERQAILRNSPVYGQYDEAQDRESAYEKLAKKAGERVAAEQQAKVEKDAARQSAQAERQARSASSRESATDRFIKNVAGSVGRQVGNVLVRQVSGALIRGILGGLTRR
jgi:DNA helicase HerA-like ATPase